MKAHPFVAALIFAAMCFGVAAAQQEQTQPKGQPGGEAPKPAPPTEIAAKSTNPKVNPDAEILVDFKKRIGDYVDIHKKAVTASSRNALPLKETTDPDKIARAEDALAATIRMYRWKAKQGDIFTPAIRDKFVRLMYPEVKGPDGHETKEILKDDAPSKIELKVNADYPAKAALPTVPANLLANMPTLPEELDYRIIGKNLILRDVKANMIVDYMTDVIR